MLPLKIKCQKCLLNFLKGIYTIYIGTKKNCTMESNIRRIRFRKRLYSVKSRYWDYFWNRGLPLFEYICAKSVFERVHKCSVASDFLYIRRSIFFWNVKFLWTRFYNGNKRHTRTFILHSDIHEKKYIYKNLAF